MRSADSAKTNAYTEACVPRASVSSTSSTATRSSSGEKNPVAATRARTPSRSLARSSVRNCRSGMVHFLRSPPQRGQHDAFDRLVVGDVRARERGGETGIGSQARIGVDLEDPRLSGGVDSEVDPRIALHAEDFASSQREVAQAVEQGGVRRRDRKSG